MDLWGHVRFGGDIVAAGEIPSADPYSFTADRSWVNHEWLAEVLMYAAYASAGATGLTLLRLLLIGATLWMVALSLGWSGVSGRQRITLAAFVAVLTYTRTQHVRPQLFSVALFAALLAVLIRSRSSRRALWLVPPLVAFWVNVHGGWIVGLAVFGLWLTLDAMGTGATWRDRRVAAFAFLAAVGATLVNPYGAGLWAFLWETVGLGRPDITEWQSIVRAQPGVVAFWVITAAAAASMCSRAWRAGTGAAHTADILVVAVLGVLSFRVSRLDAFFTLAAFTLPVRAAVAARRDARPPERALARPTPYALAVAVLVAVALRWEAVTRIDLRSASWLPEADAIAFIRANDLRGNMLTYFDWGEYAIWHLAPSIKVSVDGRRETVYRRESIERHLAVYANRAEGLTFVRQLKPDFVWLPKTLDVVSALRSTGEWEMVYEGRASALLARQAVGRSRAATASAVERFFPGP